MFHARRAHVSDEADGVVRQLAVAPVGDRRFDEGLVGVGRRRLELGALDDDPGVGLLDHVQEHVGVLLLRPLGTVPFGIGVGRDVEGVLPGGESTWRRMFSENVGRSR